MNCILTEPLGVTIAATTIGVFLAITFAVMAIKRPRMIALYLILYIISLTMTALLVFKILLMI